jgi:HEPN domain-containing protein
MSTEDWEAMYRDSIQASRDNTIDQKALKELHLAVEAILKAGLREHSQYRVPDGHDTPTYAKRLDVPKEYRQTISYLEAVYRRRYPNDPKFQTRDPVDIRSEVQELRDWIADQFL